MGDALQCSEKKKARLEKKLKKKQAEIALKTATEIPTESSSMSHSKFSVAGVIDSLRDASQKVKKIRDGSSQNYPKVCLTTDKMKGRAIMTQDILHVQLYSLLHSDAGMGKPKWCHLKPSRAVSQVVLIVVEVHDFPSEGLQLQGLIQDHFPFCRRFFRDRVLLRCSTLRELRTGLFRVAVSPLQVLKEKIVGSPTAAPRKNAKKTDFLLSVQEMVENNYPLPLDSAPDFPDHEPYSLSIPDGYKTVTDSSPVYAIDCEMCLTGSDGRHELTRVSVVDENLRVIYDSLVQPRTPITNYLTKYSGITEKLLKGVVTTVEDVQKALAKLLPPDAILLGHSLNFDLHALRLYHPYVMDLSVIYNLSGTRQLKSSLSTLSMTFLGDSIQDSKKGHCSIEDSWATMRLFKEKLLKGLDYGNVQLGWSYVDFAAERGASHTGSPIDSSDSSIPNSNKRKLDTVEPEEPNETSEEKPGKKLKYQNKAEVGQGVPFSPTLPPGLRWEKVESKKTEPESGKIDSDKLESGESKLVTSPEKKAPEYIGSPSTSRSSTESPETTSGSCASCTVTLDHAACRNNGCLCRSLTWLSCAKCPAFVNEETNSSNLEKCKIISTLEKCNGDKKQESAIKNDDAKEKTTKSKAKSKKKPENDSLKNTSTDKIDEASQSDGPATNHSDTVVSAVSNPKATLGMDFSEALGLGDLFSLGNRDFDSLGEFLKNRRKKTCIFGDADFTAKAQSIGNVTGANGGHIVSTESSEDCNTAVENFKLRLLEFDYAVIQLKSSNNPEELEKLDEAISKLHISIPKKALITMLVVPVLSDRQSLAQKEGLCCLRVKI